MVLNLENQIDESHERVTHSKSIKEETEINKNQADGLIRKVNAVKKELAEVSQKLEEATKK
jgi:seryl-tRNA synthetase